MNGRDGRESQTGKPSRQARFPGSRRRGQGEYARREDVRAFLEMPYGMTPGVSPSSRRSVEAADLRRSCCLVRPPSEQSGRRAGQDLLAGGDCRAAGRDYRQVVGRVDPQLRPGNHDPRLCRTVTQRRSPAPGLGHDGHPRARADETRMATSAQRSRRGQLRIALGHHVDDQAGHIVLGVVVQGHVLEHHGRLLGVAHRA